jgi:hypothetical protein
MKKLSRFKKIILFLNASSRRLASATTSKDDFNNQKQSFGLFLNWCLEFFLFKLLSIQINNLPSYYFAILLVTPFIFHLSIDLLFSNDLKLIEKDYSNYYGKYHYVTYCALSIISCFYAIYCLFDNI